MSAHRGYYSILDENKKFVEDNALILTAVQIATKFGVSVSSVRKYRKERLNIDARDIGKKYTDEMIEWLKENMTNYTDLTVRFNKRFGTNLTRVQINDICNKRGFGNKDLYRPQLTAKMRKRALENYPVGTETIASGYTYVKIGTADQCGQSVSNNPNWKLKHHLVYENAHGSIPPAHKVVFIDQNKTNFNLSNLACISQTEQLLMTKCGWLDGNVERFHVGLAWVRLRLSLLDIVR